MSINYKTNKERKKAKQYWRDNPELKYIRRQEYKDHLKALENFSPQPQQNNNQGGGGNSNSNNNASSTSWGGTYSKQDRKEWAQAKKEYSSGREELSINDYTKLNEKFGPGRMTQLLKDDDLKIHPTLAKDMKNNPSDYLQVKGGYNEGSGQLTEAQAMKWLDDRVDDVGNPSSYDDAVKEFNEEILPKIGFERTYTGERMDNQNIRDLKIKWVNNKKGGKGAPGISQYRGKDGNFYSRLDNTGKLKYDKDGNAYNLTMPVKQTQDSASVKATKAYSNKMMSDLGIDRKDTQQTTADVTTKLNKSFTRFKPVQQRSMRKNKALDKLKLGKLR